MQTSPKFGFGEAEKELPVFISAISNTNRTEMVQGTLQADYIFWDNDAENDLSMIKGGGANGWKWFIFLAFSCANRYRSSK